MCVLSRLKKNDVQLCRVGGNETRHCKATMNLMDDRMAAVPIDAQAPVNLASNRLGILRPTKADPSGLNSQRFATERRNWP